MKSFNFIIYLRFFYWVRILNFGVCSVFGFLAYEGMKGTTNLAVVDLSPYGSVFKEMSLQTSISIKRLLLVFFLCVYVCVSVCVCACVRVFVRACVHACVHACACALV